MRRVSVVPFCAVFSTVCRPLNTKAFFRESAQCTMRQQTRLLHSDVSTEAVCLQPAQQALGNVWKTVDTDTAAAPSSKPCIDSLRYVNLAECDREEFAAFYLENQYANPNFRALGASNDDILTYGRSIYDISALPPCLGMVCITDTGKVIGCHLAVSSDHLQHLDEEKLGKVAAHAALVKHFAKQMLDAWHLAGKEPLIHQMYCGVLEPWRGSGVFGILGERMMAQQRAHSCPWTWSYTTSANVILKYFSGKSGAATDLSATFNAKNRFVTTCLRTFIPPLLTSPQWLLSSVLLGLRACGRLPKNPLQVSKLNSFVYKGERPFRSRRVCVVVVYKSTGKGGGK